MFSTAETDEARRLAIPPLARAVVATEGRPLDGRLPAARAAVIGQDFSRVRIHDDTEAALAAATVGARAFTCGQHIVFGRGEYRPETAAGRILLTHELVHVSQQSSASDGEPATGAVVDRAALEREARTITAGGPAVPVTRGAGAALLRWDSPEHVRLGERSTGGPARPITLDCHDRDFPERGDPKRWPAAWRALIALGTPEQQRAVTVGLTYGEVVALAGDFYADFDALSKAPLKEVYRLIPLVRSGGRTEQLQAATGGRYLDLAARNVSHFSNAPAGKGNLDTWRRMHAEAVNLARRAGSDGRLAGQAWGVNAAADHFLTDAFSGGHIRQPRAALLAQGLLGQLDSKVQHDLDNEHGVDVTNARGDRPLESLWRPGTGHRGQPGEPREGSGGGGALEAGRRRRPLARRCRTGGHLGHDLPC